jgi:deaminated glutathione amidase
MELPIGSIGFNDHKFGSEAPVSEELSVAVCQLTSVDDLPTNVAAIFGILKCLEANTPDLICFPENSLYLRIRDGDVTPGLEILDPSLRKLSDWAKKHSTVIHLGSVPLKHEGRVFNSSILLTADGAILDNYRKIHLFDVDVEGHKPVRESDNFSPGQESAVFFVKGWKIGSTICYDLRFSELFLRYAKQEVDVILIPSAFLVPTGKAHWDVLTRARAIESQCYVLAAAQGGTHLGVQGGIRATYGHSIIIDPWGIVLEESRLGEEGVGKADSFEARILRSVLSRDRIKQVRAQIPMKNHRRII